MCVNSGAVAQLGERYNGIVEVVGSIPSGSTIFIFVINKKSSIMALMLPALFLAYDCLYPTRAVRVCATVILCFSINEVF